MKALCLPTVILEPRYKVDAEICLLCNAILLVLKERTSLMFYTQIGIGNLPFWSNLKVTNLSIWPQFQPVALLEVWGRIMYRTGLFSDWDTILVLLLSVPIKSPLVSRFFLHAYFFL